jgi:hypothetical protein
VDWVEVLGVLLVLLLLVLMLVLLLGVSVTVTDTRSALVGTEAVVSTVSAEGV